MPHRVNSEHSSRRPKTLCFRQKLQVSDLERQVAAEKSGAQQKQERTLDEVERLERKVTAAREEKNDALKGGEKLRHRDAG